MITTNELNLAATKLSGITNEAINQYTQWHFVNAVSYELIGVALGIACYKTFKYLKKDSKDFEIVVVLWLLALLISLVLIEDNLVNIICPRAYAIHQLIIDVKP